MNKSLSELSFDTANNITVCNYKNEFVDFDNLKGRLRRDNIPNSPDMVYINDEKEEIWFVEFKSSNKRNLSNFKN